MHGDAPKYLPDLVCPYKPASALRSANNNLLMVVRTHVKAGDNPRVVAGATLWNALPNSKDVSLFSHIQGTPKDIFLLTVLAA